MATCYSKSLAVLSTLMIFGLGGRLNAQVGLGLQIGIGPYGGIYVGGAGIPFGPPPLAAYRSLRPANGTYYPAPRLSYQLVLPYAVPPAFLDRSAQYYNYAPYGYSQPRQFRGDDFNYNEYPDSRNLSPSFAPRVVSPNSPDLRPGMVLPDGARVLSVGPIGGGSANTTGATSNAEVPSLAPEQVSPSSVRATQRAAF